MIYGFLGISLSSLGSFTLIIGPISPCFKSLLLPWYALSTHQSSCECIIMGTSIIGCIQSIIKRLQHLIKSRSAPIATRTWMGLWSSRKFISPVRAVYMHVRTSLKGDKIIMGRDYWRSSKIVFHSVNITFYELNPNYKAKVLVGSRNVGGRRQQYNRIHI